MQINVKRTHPEAVLPTYAHDGDSGFDLYAIEDAIVEPGQTIKVRTGLSFAIPTGFELQIRPRSGVSAKTNLRVSNSPGTIDASYRGEVMVLIDNIAQPEYRLYHEVIDEDTVDYNLLKVTTYGDELQFIDAQHAHIRVGNIINTIDGGTLFLDDKMHPFGVEYPKGTYLIRRGDRIAQGVIAPVVRVDIIEVDELSDTTRGDNGFGSTGTR